MDHVKRQRNHDKSMLYAVNVIYTAYILYDISMYMCNGLLAKKTQKKIAYFLLIANEKFY